MLSSSFFGREQCTSDHGALLCLQEGLYHTFVHMHNRSATILNTSHLGKIILLAQPPTETSEVKRPTLYLKQTRRQLQNSPIQCRDKAQNDESRGNEARSPAKLPKPQIIKDKQHKQPCAACHPIQQMHPDMATGGVRHSPLSSTGDCLPGQSFCRLHLNLSAPHR